MIKFFRNIRKQFLEQGNIRKYMLYAIGEIFLVVVGILIAPLLESKSFSFLGVYYYMVLLSNDPVYLLRLHLKNHKSQNLLKMI